MPDPVDIMELSRTRVGARVSRSGPNLLSFMRNKINIEATFEFVTTEGAKSGIDPIHKTLDDSKEDIIYSDEFKLPEVKEGFLNYELTVHVTSKVDQTQNPKQALAKYRVWPNNCEIEATFTDGGAKAEHFEFRILRGSEEIANWETEKDGTYDEPIWDPGELTLRAVSPWILDSREDPKPGRKWTVKVTKKPWKAKIYTPTGGRTPTTALQQIVNQPADYPTNCGSLVKLVIGPDDVSLGKKDEEIKIRVTFPADNSKRNSPMPALQTSEDPGTAVPMKVTTAKPGEAELVYEHTLELPADGEKVECYVQMGVAGGDQCKIEVGVTDTLEDAVLHIANWRKVKVELVVPKNSLRASSPKILVDDEAKHGDALEAKLKALLDSVNVLFEYPATQAYTYEAAAIDGKIRGVDWAQGVYTSKAGTRAQYMTIDGAKFANWVVKTQSSWFFWTERKLVRKPLSGKVFVVDGGMLKEIRTEVTANAAHPKDTLTIQWCDFLSRPETSVAYKPGSKMNFIVREFTSATPIVIDPLPFHIFEHDPCMADGTPSIRKITWHVRGVRKVGTQEWFAPPGWVDKTAAQVALASTAVEVAKYVTFHDSNKITLSLPNADPGDPGNFLVQTHNEMVPNSETGLDEATDVDYQCLISVEILAVGLHFNVLGSALQGNIAMTSRAGETTEHGAAHTIAHEMGHNLGQAYMENLGAGELHGTPRGSDNRGRSATNEIPGLPFADTTIPKGPFYAGKGFAGAHCAIKIKEKIEAALSKPAQRKAVYDEPNWGAPSQKNRKYFEVSDTDHCIMFATTDNAATKARSFCKECTTYLKATDADDITKDWKA
jgi:hypothetical protein